MILEYLLITNLNKKIKQKIIYITCESINFLQIIIKLITTCVIRLDIIIELKQYNIMIELSNDSIFKFLSFDNSQV